MTKLTKALTRGYLGLMELRLWELIFLFLILLIESGKSVPVIPSIGRGVRKAKDKDFHKYGT